MKATEILSAEHRVIEQVLDCLDAMAQQAQISRKLDKAAALDAVAFFRTFADKCHHGKEEVHLFPAMEARGFPRNGGPTGVMLHEHDLGRKCVGGMETAANKGDVAAFVENAQSFSALLRQHIQKEDHCLFSMANQAFTTADQEQLLAAFEHVEHEEMGEGTHEKFLGIANALAAKFGVQPRPEAKAEHHCCGHH